MLCKLATQESTSWSEVLKSPVMNARGFRIRFFAKRINALLACCAFLIGISAPRPIAAEAPGGISSARINRAVISMLLTAGVKKPMVISHIDLTEPFETPDQWTLVVVEESSSPPPPVGLVEDHGPIFVCFVKGSKPNCSEKFYKHVNNQYPWPSIPFHLLVSKVVYAGRGKSRPFLLIKLCGAKSFDNDCGVATVLFRYQKQTNRFLRVFLGVTGRNNNQATRFVERGPLQGDIIVDYPTGHAPYTYWIDVYAPGKSGNYIRILRYRGRTGYSDGNPLAVIDSEMPEILRHMGLWQPGDALPVPVLLPNGCNHLFFRNGEEWCDH